MQPRDMTDLTPDEIAAELDRGRDDLAQSIDGLRDRLSVDTLIGDAVGFARANMAPYTRALDSAVRANPMAAVLAGVGLAWLVLGRRGSTALPDAPLAGTKFEALSRWEDEGGPPAPHVDPDLTWIAEADALRDRVSGVLARLDATARDRMRPAADLAKDRAQVLADLASATREVMLRGLENLSSDARNHVVALREQAYGARLAAVRQGTRLIEDRPLLAGAIGAAIGAAVASALPRTATEDRLFGHDRDRLLRLADNAFRDERARAAAVATQLANTVATDVKDRARQLVTEAI